MTTKNYSFQQEEKKLVLEAGGIQLWTLERIQAFRQALLDWYDQEKRTLPWRESTSAYAVWVSEIMLQQTRVDTVIPYYTRFMHAFPTIKELAEADTDDLLKLWEGLGYYSRVRNMQHAAQQIMSDFGGIFPRTPKEILTLKGIGPYTGGAIASIAFQLPEPAVDGNVMRVVSRLFEIDADIAKPATRKIFEAIIRVLIDPDRPGDFNQALMDLGATICTPTNYDGERSPVKEFDQSYLNGTWHHYPVKTKKKKAVLVYYDALAIQNEKGEWLVEQRPQTGLLAGMWQFPLFEKEGSTSPHWKDFPEGHDAHLLACLETQYGLVGTVQKRHLGEVTHLFSHLKWHVSVHIISVQSSKDTVLPSSCQWIQSKEREALVFPVPQQKMWEKVVITTQEEV